MHNLDPYIVEQVKITSERVKDLMFWFGHGTYSKSYHQAFTRAGYDFSTAPAAKFMSYSGYGQIDPEALQFGDEKIRVTFLKKSLNNRDDSRVMVEIGRTSKFSSISSATYSHKVFDNYFQELTFRPGGWLIYLNKMISGIETHLESILEELKKDSINQHKTEQENRLNPIDDSNIFSN